MNVEINLAEFVRESNRIEGIHRDPTGAEISAHSDLFGLAELGVSDIEAFVGVVQPDAILRRLPHLNVRVGSHVAPQGGPQIVMALEGILVAAKTDDAYTVHHRYETLHPFTDGNGRSGRALWLWMMGYSGRLSRALSLGFLHNWYYQSLEAGR